MSKRESRSPPTFGTASEVRSREHSGGSKSAAPRRSALGEIGFVGLGRMGAAMAANLAAEGLQVIAYVRRPDQIGKPDLSTAHSLTRLREDYFGRGTSNTSYFSIPIGISGGSGPNSGRFGTLGRNTFRGPGQQNWDFSLLKNFKLTERQSIRFTTDFFNIWNHANFANPSSTDVENPGAFGKIFSTVGTPRLIQFSLRYAF